MLQSFMAGHLPIQLCRMIDRIPLILLFPTLLSACCHANTVATMEVPLQELESQREVSAGIPFEYIPQPGKCRFWYPDRSSEEQPDPERCLEIAANVPPGAWLVYGGSTVRTYRIQEYDVQDPGTVSVIRYYEAESGRFLREERVCQ